MAMVFPQSMETTASDFGGTVCAAADADTMHAATAAKAIRCFRVPIHCRENAILQAPEDWISCL
jgi:hypothetical protein